MIVNQVLARKTGSEQKFGEDPDIMYDSKTANIATFFFSLSLAESTRLQNSVKCVFCFLLYTKETLTGCSK